MLSTKAFLCVIAALIVVTFGEITNKNRSDSFDHEIDGNNEQNEGRSKRFLFNLFPGLFNNNNNEDYQVQTLMQQRRVLDRVQPVNQYNQGFDGLFSPESDNFYLQGLLQQRRIRQRYFDLTGERITYNYNSNDDDD